MSWAGRVGKPEKASTPRLSFDKPPCFRDQRIATARTSHRWLNTCNRISCTALIQSSECKHLCCQYDTPILGLACCCAARAHEKAYSGLSRLGTWKPRQTIPLIYHTADLTAHGPDMQSKHNERIFRPSVKVSRASLSYSSLHGLVPWLYVLEGQIDGRQTASAYIKLVVFGSLSKMDAYEQRLLFLIHFIENSGCTTSNDVTGRLKSCTDSNEFQESMGQCSQISATM